MNIKNNESIAYAKIPRLDELYCITCEVDFIEVVQNSLAKSNYHWQILKCRLIIHIFPEVIASPIPGTDNSLFIITSKAFVATGKLQENLRALNMLFGTPQPVTVDTYTICLQYTIECKLSPMWNKVAQYYVQGQNFYIPAEELNALQMQISIDGNIVLYTYGYRLPKAAEGTVYYEIKFPILGANNFIYPSTCVASKPIQVLSCNDTGYIISQFVDDIHVTIPEILGKRLNISFNDKNQNVELFSLNEYETSIQDILSSTIDKESISIHTNTKDVNSFQQSKALSSYERWLLTESSKSTDSILKPIKPLSAVKQLHTASRPIGVNNRSDVIIDEVNTINPIKSDLSKYNGTQTYATLPCDNTQTDAICSNSVKITKKKFQTFTKSKPRKKI
ncbi:hypothetical protein KPH14_004704 [Odynerus spinipes]|uniref:DUF4708 domain-containing protein n=1 Tax=Odynerus spinipes TaxID=1348599 RepID=A0AAD9RMA2_9HYME|nr:hypothetical protein KPH14_004704 [Odynerus spinipes]